MKNDQEQSKIQLAVSSVFLVLLFFCYTAYLVSSKHVEITTAITKTATIYFFFLCQGVIIFVFWYIAMIVRNYWRKRKNTLKKN
jgi:uncharacterized membrane protein